MKKPDNKLSRWHGQRQGLRFCTIRRYVFVLSLCLVSFLQPLNGAVAAHTKSLIGAQDAALLATPGGDIILARNQHVPLIPASVLKILTALVSLHYLGDDFRYCTEVYLNPQHDLRIKGFGDPLLISEVMTQWSNELASTLVTHPADFRHLVMDDSYFQQPLSIPGVNDTAQPYDSPNGALCANFNTVNFHRDAQGNLSSAEPQTPLLPFAIKKIIAGNLPPGRVVFSHHGSEATQYAGHLLRYFLEQAGLRFKGSVQVGKGQTDGAALITRFCSPYRHREILQKLLTHSNNFIANQLLITSGAMVYGPPGNLSKGVNAAKTYLKETLGITVKTIYEGSGISRQNRISAAVMHRLLIAFAPYHTLLRGGPLLFYKTGTLQGVRTRAGYIKKEGGGLYPFVVMINTPGKDTQPVVEQFIRTVARQ